MRELVDSLTRGPAWYEGPRSPTQTRLPSVTAKTIVKKQFDPVSADALVSTETGKQRDGVAEMEAALNRMVELAKEEIPPEITEKVKKGMAYISDYIFYLPEEEEK